MTIGVFFGGKNPEHDISILTGHLALAGLRTAKMDAIGVYVGKDGSWHIGEELHDIANFKKQRDFSALSKWHLNLESSRGKMVFKQKGLFGKTVTIEVLRKKQKVQVSVTITEVPDAAPRRATSQPQKG